MACVGSASIPNAETQTTTIITKNRHMKKAILLLSIIGLLSFSTQEPKTVTLTLSIDEVQMIYDALGEMPAKKVEALRNKIVIEANKQLSDTTKKK